VAGILKKITSIEPDESDILNAINANPTKIKSKGPLIKSINEVGIDDDPIPKFITRDKPRDIFVEDISVENVPLKEGTPQQETNTDIAEDNIVGRELSQSSTTAPITQSPFTTLSSPSTAWMKWVGIAVVVLWLASSFSFLYGSFDFGRKWTDLSPIQITGIIMAIILPAILLGILFYTFRQLSSLSLQSTAWMPV